MNPLSYVASALVICSLASFAQDNKSNEESKELQELLQQAAKTNKTMVIQPGVSVASVKLGMPMEDVEKVLGKPYEVSGKVLHYQHLGLSIVPKRGGGVGAIMCGSWCADDEDLLAKAFKGETKEGIKMGSSSEEVEKVFGAPDKKEPVDTWIRWNYPSQGMEFTFNKGKLRHIVIKTPRIPLKKQE